MNTSNTSNMNTSNTSNMNTSPEIARLFDGMTCQFAEIPNLSFEVSTIRGSNRIVEVDLVECHDGITRPMDECSIVVWGSDTDWRGKYLETKWVEDGELSTMCDDGEIHYLDYRDIYAVSKLCIWCDDHAEWEWKWDCEELNGIWYPERDNMILYAHDGTAFVRDDDDYVYVDSHGEWYSTDEVHACDESGDWEIGDACDCDQCGNSSGERIFRYHDSHISCEIHRGSSGFAVGFEVEKTSVRGSSCEGDYVGESPLFAYWETDSSCGVEGVTHAFDPIDPIIIRRFESYAKESRELLNEPCDKRCGGHINISSQSHSPRDLMASFRSYAPLWYAVFRNRLNNSYCDHDKKIEHGREKYSPVRVRDFGIEVRLPSRVQNASQLQRRFDWMGVTCQAIRDGNSFNSYVRSCRDILLYGAYGNNRKKYAKVLRLARKFRIWMLDGIAHESIQQYV